MGAHLVRSFPQMPQRPPKTMPCLQGSRIDTAGDSSARDLWMTSPLSKSQRVTVPSRGESHVPNLDSVWPSGETYAKE